MSDLSRRDHFVQTACEDIRSRGMVPDVEAISKYVERQLEIADRIARLAKASKAKRIAKSDPTQGIAAQLAKESGQTFYRDDAPGIERKINPPNPKEAALTMRIALLCQRRQRNSGDSKRSIDEFDYDYPGFAKQVLNQWLGYTLGEGNYRGLRKHDKARVFARAMEDIADKSNVIPGLPKWWIK